MLSLENTIGEGSDKKCKQVQQTLENVRYEDRAKEAKSDILKNSLFSRGCYVPGIRHTCLQFNLIESSQEHTQKVTIDPI